MAGTIKEIAERAGVSRGTVDRALNNRGRIKPEVAERILAIAKELDYHSNRKSKKNTQNPDKHIKIGVITQLSEASFMIPVKEGIRDAGRELEYLGVELLLKDIESVDEEAQMEAIDELESKGIDGLAIMPVQSEYVRTAEPLDGRKRNSGSNIQLRYRWHKTILLCRPG